MRDIKVISCGTNYTHEKDFSFSKADLLLKDCYVFVFFKTDFLSNTKHGMRTGKAFSYILHTPYADIYHTNMPNAKIGFVNDWMYLKGSYIEHLVKKMDILTDIIVPVFNTTSITQIIEQIQTEISEEKVFKELRIEGLVTNLFIELARNDSTIIFSAQNEDLEKIKNIKSLIHEDFNNKWTLKSMAELSGYSVSHFISLYKKFFNKSPVDDLIDCRLTHAKFMIESNTMSFSKIAQECGFGTLYYFSRIFKERVGLSPTEYKKKFFEEN